MSKAKIYINGAWVDLGGAGLTVRGTYDAASTYQKTGTTMDVVQYNGSLWGYINAVASSGNTPPESAQTVSNDYWTLLVAKGDPGPQGVQGEKGDKGDPGESASGAAVGSISLFAGATIPEGYLLCDGAALSRTVYAELFSAIGTTWGNGDGSTTFNLPDFSGKFIRGTGGNAAALGTVQAEGLPNAEGWFQLRYGSIVSADNSMFTFIQDTTTTSASYTGQQATTKITMSLSGANPIFGASNHVTPENCALNVIIKYQG